LRTVTGFKLLKNVRNNTALKQKLEIKKKNTSSGLRTYTARRYGSQNGRKSVGISKRTWHGLSEFEDTRKDG
jgi:hypothetical protein